MREPPTVESIRKRESTTMADLPTWEEVNVLLKEIDELRAEIEKLKETRKIQ